MHQQLNHCSVYKTNLIAENLQIMQLWAVITAKQRVQEQKKNIKTQHNPFLPNKVEMITCVAFIHTHSRRRTLPFFFPRVQIHCVCFSHK